MRAHHTQGIDWQGATNSALELIHRVLVVTNKYGMNIRECVFCSSSYAEAYNQYLILSNRGSAVVMDQRIRDSYLIAQLDDWV